MATTLSGAEQKLEECKQLCEKHNLTWRYTRGTYHIFRVAKPRNIWLDKANAVNDLLTKIRKLAGVGTTPKAAPVKNVLQRARVMQ